VVNSDARPSRRKTRLSGLRNIATNKPPQHASATIAPALTALACDHVRCQTRDCFLNLNDRFIDVRGICEVSFVPIQFSFSDVISDEYSSSNRRSSVEEARDSLSHLMAPAAMAAIRIRPVQLRT
jgi:hypothetical protein